MSRPLAYIVLHAVLAEGTTRLAVRPVILTPTAVELERNDYRTADTLRATLRWPQLPFDPRQVVAAGVDLYLGPADPTTGTLTLDEGSIAFTGHVDRIEASAGDDGVEVKIEARDFTALLLDTPITETLALGKLKATAQALLAQVPGAAGLTVTLSDTDDIPLTAPNGRTRYNPPEGADAWTVLTDLGRQAGAVVYVDLNNIVVAGPRTLWPDTASPLLLWGRDLTRLSVEAELTATKRRGVKVISRDAAGVTHSAVYPETTRVVVDARRRSAAEAEHLLDWVVPGVPASRLPELARRIWEAQARGQVKARVETRRMTTLDGGAAVWRLKHSHAVRLGGPWDVAAQQIRLGGRAAVDALTGPPLYMPRQVADAFARSAALLRASAGALYVKKATHRLDITQGYTCELELESYVEVSP